jgi:hypothetical protein
MPSLAAPQGGDGSTANQCVIVTLNTLASYSTGIAESFYLKESFGPGPS